MPLYFFEVSDGEEVYDDSEGVILPDLDAAKASAADVASAVVLFGEGDCGFSVIIRNASGEELGRSSIT